MQRHKLKLLALLAIFAVAPASGHRMIAASANHDGRSCPYEAARAEARASASAAAGETVVTLTEQLRPAPMIGGSFVTP